MKHVNRFFLAFLVLCIAFSSLCIPSYAANTSKTSDVKLTSLRVLSTTNPKGAKTDIAVGNWIDAEGTLHKNSLKFWVVHGNGYNDTESVYYDVGPTNFDTLTGTVSALKDCGAGAEMWVNIYADRKLLFSSDIITPESGSEYFSIDITGRSEIWVECKTSTASQGYCIVDASVSAEKRIYKKEFSSYDICYDEYGNAEILTVYEDVSGWGANFCQGFIGPLAGQYYDHLLPGVYTFSYNGYGEMKKVMFREEGSDKSTLFAEFRYETEKQENITHRYIYRSSPLYKNEWLYMYEIDVYGESTKFKVNPPENPNEKPIDTNQKYSDDEGTDDYSYLENTYRYATPYVIVNRYGVDLEASGLIPDKENVFPEADDFILSVAYRSNKYGEEKANILNIYDSNLRRKVEIGVVKTVMYYNYSVIDFEYGHAYIRQEHAYNDQYGDAYLRDFREILYTNADQYNYKLGSAGECTEITCTDNEVYIPDSQGTPYVTDYKGKSLSMEPKYPHGICECYYSKEDYNSNIEAVTRN